MKLKLLLRAVVKMVMGFALLGAMLFLPAGTLQFANAWVFLIALFVPMLIVGAVMLFVNPALLEKRLDAKEKQTEQKWVVKLSGLLFIVGFVLAGLNFRYSWCVMPEWGVWVSVAVFVLSYALYAEVMRENTYLSRTIKVEENQQVISTGLYGIVRHPMYSATVLLFLSMPLVLGSPISFLLMLLYIPIIGVRIKNEEQFLTENLAGYAEYKAKVKYKLIPLIY